MNLQQLEYIIALNEQRHFGRAADQCDISQPTLSTMVQKLEEELGVKIFDRSRGSVSPTPVGTRILEQAAIILRQASILGEIVLDETSHLGGRVTIGLLPTIAPYLLPMLSPIIQQALPDLEVSFVEMLTSECVEALYSGQVDMAIVASQQLEGLKTKTVYYEEFLGYVSRSLPMYKERYVRTSEVDASQLWLLDEGHCFRDQLLRFCQLRRNVKPKLSYRRGSLQTFMHMVERGMGMTFIPELSLETLTSEQRELVRSFAMPRPCRPIVLCTRHDYARSALVDKIVELTLSAVPTRMHHLQPEQHLA